MASGFAIVGLAAVGFEALGLAAASLACKVHAASGTFFLMLIKPDG